MVKVKVTSDICPHCKGDKITGYDIQIERSIINLYLRCYNCDAYFKQNYHKHGDLKWLK